LIDAGSPVNPPPSLQTSPLVKAAELGHEAMVRVLLEAGAEVDKGLATPLNIAAGEGHTEIVRLLIAAGADVNLTDSDDCRPLLEAAGNGHLDIVRLLVAAGADVNIQLQGDTPLLTAADNGHQEVFDFLAPLVHDDIRQKAECALPKGLAHKARGDQQDVEAFIEAAMMGDLSTVQAAIANGIDINAFGSNGCTALMYAAFYGHVAVVQALIAAGANLDLQNEEDGPCPHSGMSALMQAAESTFSGHRVEVITLLAQAGANLDLQDDAGFTALMHAAGGRYQNPEPAQALLAAGAQLRLRDTEGNTALMLAEQMRHRKIAAELRRAGAV
jgi:ankyrin repeat protein